MSLQKENFLGVKGKGCLQLSRVFFKRIEFENKIKNTCSCIAATDILFVGGSQYGLWRTLAAFASWRMRGCPS